MPHLLIPLLLCSMLLSAKDFGTYGTTFSIAEEDLLLVLRERLAQTQWDEEKRDQIRNAFVKRIEVPKGRQLLKAEKLRVFEFDPSIVLQEDIKDHEGKAIVYKNTHINPLEFSVLREDLLIFDGTDISQVAWAKSQQGRWILANGKPLDLEDREQRPVYFDQGAYLSLKLGIRALPAKVKQESQKLVIEEMPCF
jgi:conjugal transfer pilus assembly protein TraW